jgi:hypothetical protein
MISFIIAIFFIAIIIAFGMLSFRVWELRTGRVVISEKDLRPLPTLSFRQTERTVLYLTKYVIQAIIFTGAKYWFITSARAKKGIQKLPKVHALLHKKSEKRTTINKISFIKRSVIESKIKIRRIKEKVRKDHEQKAAEILEGIPKDTEVPEIED